MENRTNFLCICEHQRKSIGAQPVQYGNGATPAYRSAKISQGIIEENKYGMLVDREEKN